MATLFTLVLKAPKRGENVVFQFTNSRECENFHYAAEARGFKKVSLDLTTIEKNSQSALDTLRFFE